MCVLPTPVLLDCNANINRINLVDWSSPISSGSLANPWRDRLSTSVPGDPAVRDRDLKLLAWLEYAEMMRDSKPDRERWYEMCLTDRHQSGNSKSPLVRLRRPHLRLPKKKPLSGQNEAATAPCLTESEKESGNEKSEPPNPPAFIVQAMKMRRIEKRSWRSGGNIPLVGIPGQLAGQLEVIRMFPLVLVSLAVMVY